jgi:hypothetical protein
MMPETLVQLIVLLLFSGLCLVVVANTPADVHMYCKSPVSLLMTSGQDIPAPRPRAVMGQHKCQQGIHDQSQRLRSWELTGVIKRTNHICFSGGSSTGAGDTVQ